MEMPEEILRIVYASNQIITALSSNSTALWVFRYRINVENHLPVKRNSEKCEIPSVFLARSFVWCKVSLWNLVIRDW